MTAIFSDRTIYFSQKRKNDVSGILLVNDLSHDATHNSARLNKTTTRSHSDSSLTESLKDPLEHMMYNDILRRN